MKQPKLQFPMTLPVNVIGASGAPHAVLTLGAERDGQVIGEVLVERWVPGQGGVRQQRRRSSLMLSLTDVPALLKGRGVMTSVFNDLHTLVPVKRS